MRRYTPKPLITYPHRPALVGIAVRGLGVYGHGAATQVDDDRMSATQGRINMGRAPAMVWCPTCEDWTNCRSLNASEFEWGNANPRHCEVDGICYHQRFRQCTECADTFYTAELAYSDLQDLLKDRANLTVAYAKLDAVRKGLRARVK